LWSPARRNKRVPGYDTLSASVLTLADLPDELARKLPRCPQLPVTLLGRLAVDQSAGAQGPDPGNPASMRLPGRSP